MTIKFKDRTIFAGVHLERLPVHTADSEVVDHYDFRQVLKLYSVISFVENHYDASMCCKHIMRKQIKKLKSSENKGKPFGFSSVKANFVTKDLLDHEEYYFTLNEGKGAKIYVRTPVDLRYIEEGRTIYAPMKVKYQTLELVDNKVKVSKEASSIMGQEENQEMVLKFFEGLEKYGIKFSENQRKMLIANTNTLVLGRSGTGKTTISAFKILALDLLFMAYKKKYVHKNDNFRLTLQDFKTLSGCSTVFCTASPVLTNEVRRFYHDLIVSIKKVLKAREDRQERKKQKQKQKEEEKKSNEETKDEEDEKEEESFNAFDDNEQEKTEEDEKLREGLISALEMAKNDILEDLEIEKQMTAYTNIKMIPKEEFPLFLTVKKLVYMLDGD